MSVNHVIILGNVGKDPQVQYTPSGLAITKLSVATSEEWMDKATCEKKKETEWHMVTFFGKMAETVGQYVQKGSQLYIEGRLKTTSYEKDGITRYSTDIIASKFQFVGSKKDNSNQNFNQNNQFQNNQYGNQFNKNQNSGFQSNDNIPF